jgi:hypothetical protein
MTLEERIAYLVSTSETLVAQLQDLKSLNEKIQKASELTVCVPCPRGNRQRTETWRE